MSIASTSVVVVFVLHKYLIMDAHFSLTLSSASLFHPTLDGKLYPFKTLSDPHSGQLGLNLRGNVTVQQKCTKRTKKQMKKKNCV